MKVLNLLIILTLGTLIIKSLIVILKDMEGRKKMVMNGIILLFLAVLVLSSILTFSTGKDLTDNFGGIVGGVIAKSLLETFGAVSYTHLTLPTN